MCITKAEVIYVADSFQINFILGRCQHFKFKAFIEMLPWYHYGSLKSNVGESFLLNLMLLNWIVGEDVMQGQLRGAGWDQKSVMVWSVWILTQISDGVQQKYPNMTFHRKGVSKFQQLFFKIIDSQYKYKIVIFVKPYHYLTLTKSNCCNFTTVGTLMIQIHVFPLHFL